MAFPPCGRALRGATDEREIASIRPGSDRRGRDCCGRWGEKRIAASARAWPTHGKCSGHLERATAVREGPLRGGRGCTPRHTTRRVPALISGLQRARPRFLGFFGRVPWEAGSVSVCCLSGVFNPCNYKSLAEVTPPDTSLGHSSRNPSDSRKRQSAC